MAKVSPPIFVGKQTRKSSTSKIKVYLPNRDYVLGQHLLEILADRPFSTQTGMSKILKDKKRSARKARIRSTLATLKKIDCCQNYNIITAPSGHKCTNGVYTRDFFVNTDSIQKFLKFIKEKPHLPRGKKTKTGFIAEKIKPTFFCVKCKKFIPYKQGKEYEVGLYEYFALSSRGILVLLSLPQSKISDFDKHYKNNEILYLLGVLEKSQKKSYVKPFLSKLSNDAQNLDDLIKISDISLKQIKSEISEMKINKSRHKRLFRLQGEFINESMRKRLTSSKLK